MSRLLEWLERVGKAFALVFMILLIMAAAMLAMNHEDYANLLAEYAYYSLVVSVVSLLIVTAKEGGEEEGDEKEDGCGS